MAWPVNWATGEVMTAARLLEWTNAIKLWGGSVDANFNPLRNASRVYLMDGSDAAPSGTFENAQTTGLKLATTNAMGIVTAGVERTRFRADGSIGFGAFGSELMLIWPSGSIGFGTAATPGKNWHFHKAVADDHFYLSSVSPSLRFGNHATFASRTLEAVLAMPTSVDHFFSGTAAGDAILYTALGSGRIVLAPNQSIANAVVIANNGKVGIGTGTTAPATLLHLGGANAHMTIDETTNNPASPTASVQCQVFLKNDRFIILFNRAGSINHYYLNLAADSGAWTHVTGAPA